MNDRVVVKLSEFNFAETVRRLEETIRGGGATVFATIDQAEAARTAGLSLRPTTLILFGNPKGGTPLMDRWPICAIALPLRLLVWEDSAVRVAFEHMQPTLEALGVPAGEPHAAAMASLLETVTSAICR